MNHTSIEEQQIAERYVRGKLTPEEAALFEEHYLSCQECLDRLDLAESMERGFKRAASQDAAQLAAVQQVHQLAVVAWLARLGRSRQMAALVMIVFVVAILPGLFVMRQVRERDRELTAARTALEQERGRSAAGSRTAEEAERLRKDLDASRSDLAREQKARAAADQELAAARQPQGNVPILFLDAERGSSAGEPTHRLRLPHSPGWIVLALEIDPPHQPAYRVVLRGAGGREVWRGTDLRLDERDALSLSLPSTLLAPGDSTLTVEGLAPGGKPVAAGRFVFRVLPAG
ncbi:MAG TPA: zf-HC2 domain-containing protein [Thermoanaerobaculia bacterium]